MDNATTPAGAERPAPPLVSVDEHEQGWKEIEVEFRSGRKAVWRLKAPPSRAARLAFLEVLEGRDATAVVRLALPEYAKDEDLDRLTMDSLGQVEAIASTLAFGETHQKKMEAAARVLAKAMFAPSSPPNSGSSAPATAPEPSGAGASQSCASTSKNSTVT